MKLSLKFFDNQAKWNETFEIFKVIGGKLRFVMDGGCGDHEI